MALAKDTPLPEIIGDYADAPVAAATVIYEGSLVAVSAAGYAKPAADGDTLFLGVCEKKADNSAGAAGAINARVKRGIQYRVMALSGAAQADVGDAVYATADDTITKTAGTALPIGKIHAFLGSGQVIVLLQPNL